MRGRRGEPDAPRGRGLPQPPAFQLACSDALIAFSTVLQIRLKTEREEKD